MSNDTAFVVALVINSKYGIRFCGFLSADGSVFQLKFAIKRIACCTPVRIFIA
jgi:hypothetical protein